MRCIGNRDGTGAPPRWERLLGRLLPPEQRDAAVGDAAEELALRARRDGPDAARRWYIRQVLRSLGPALVRTLIPRATAGPPAEGRQGRTAMWLRDCRLGLRMLAREPLFTAIALVTLAVGVGATTAFFGVYRAVFLNPIPLPEPGRITFLMEEANFGCCGPASGPDYRDFVTRSRAFSGLGILKPGSVTLTGGEAERVYATAVSASLFQFLGVPPLLGRALRESDELDPSVVVLNYGLWQRRFGGRADALGTTLEIDGAPYTIVGVMPRTFDVPSPWLGTRTHALYTPFARAWLSGDRGSHSYPVVARLGPGETLAMAQSDMSRVMRELAHEYPKTNAERDVKVFTAHDYMFGKIGQELVLILGAAGLVLLIACANIAALQLARGTARATELAVRAALGATRPALIRLLLAESLVLAAAGGLASLTVARLMVDGLRALLPASIPRVDAIRVDGAVLAFAVGAAALTALVFGVLPAIVASRGRLVSGLGTRGGGDLTPQKQRLRDGFIVAQIALGLMLANSASLLVRSYALLRSQVPGFEAEGVLTMSVDPYGEHYKTKDQVRAYYDALLAQTSAVPGVKAVGTISLLPLSGGTNGHVLVEGRPPRANDESGPLVEVTSITGDYFAAMGIGLVGGRTLRPADEATGVLDAVINRHFAREAWPGADPVGRRFSFSDSPPDWVTVVGVVDDIRQWGPEQPPVSQAYFTISHGWTTGGYLVVRGAGDPAALAPSVRQAVLAVDRTEPPADVQTMNARVDRAFGQRRFYTLLMGLFAVASVLLAGGGVYGTVSYYVTRRRRELGLRAALGASGAGLVGLVVGRGAKLAALGVVIGLLGIWGAASVLSTLLYGIAPLDGWTMVGGAVLFAAVAILASAVPARRAARISPIMALRVD